MLFGIHLRLPIEQALSAEPTAYSAELEVLVTQLKEKQHDAITQVIDNQKVAKAYQKKNGTTNGQETDISKSET